MILCIVSDGMMMDPRTYWHLAGGHHHRCSFPDVAGTLLNNWVDWLVSVFLEGTEMAQARFEPLLQ